MSVTGSSSPRCSKETSTAPKTRDSWWWQPVPIPAAWRFTPVTAQAGRALRPRASNPPDDQEGARLALPDRDEERPVEAHHRRRGRGPGDHRGRARGLRAELVHVDVRLVHDAGDVELLLLRVDPAEVRPVGVERHGHAHVLERPVERIAELEAELRHVEHQASALEARGPAAPAL